jgi:HSP20 family protein
MTRRPAAPWPELAGLQERLGKLLEEALMGAGEMSGGGPAAVWRPVLDLLETPDAYLLYAELPGVQRPDVTLESDGRTLELSGVRRSPEHGFVRLEGSWGPFRRRLELPEPVIAERIEARFRRGILEVLLPKRIPAEGVSVPVSEG